MSITFRFYHIFKNSLFLVCIALTTLHSQSITIFNSSFEGESRDAVNPIGWIGCEDGTTPDILPGPWGVYLPASEGQTYMGLIVRKNGTWECVGQRLPLLLKESNCYFFKLMLAHSVTYNGYNKPAVIRIWGGSERCEKRQKLFESPPINHSNWKPYIVKFKPKKDIDFIIIEAYYNEKLNYTYNGNVLIDALTIIQTCDRAELVSK
ncbi:MAG: hypothetical protein ABI761_03715 [Saprospiraceae bacterium]